MPCVHRTLFAPLIWLVRHANMGSHIMKTTFRSLAEEGLRLVRAKKRQRKSGKLPPLVTYGGSGLTEEFKDWNCVFSGKIFRL